MLKKLIGNNLNNVLVYINILLSIVSLSISLSAPAFRNELDVFYFSLGLIFVQLVTSAVVIFMLYDFRIFLGYVFPMILNIVSVVLIILGIMETDNDNYKVVLLVFSFLLTFYFIVMYGWNALERK